MRMMVADLINGTSFSKIEIANTIGAALVENIEAIPAIFKNTNENFFFSITKTDRFGIQTVGTAQSILNTFADSLEGIVITFKNFTAGTLNVYFGTGTQGTISLSNMFYSYSIPLYGTNSYSNNVLHKLIFHPYGTGFTNDATWNFGTEEGTTFGSMRLYTEKPFPTILQSVEYSQVYSLPEQAGYSPYFTEDKIKHKLDNGKTLTYFKGFNFNADITFEHLNGTELDNLKTIKNLKTNLRFFPNIAETPDLSYDAIWDSDFNYPFTTPTWTKGGYNGNIHFEGISRLGSIGDTI